MLKLKILLSVICFYILTCESTLGQENYSFTKTEIDSILSSQISGKYKLDTINFLFGDIQYFKHLFGLIHIRTHRGLERRTVLLCDGKIHTERTTQDECGKNTTKQIIIRYSFINDTFVKFSLTEYWINKKPNADLLRHEVII